MLYYSSFTQHIWSAFHLVADSKMHIIIIIIIIIRVMTSCTAPPLLKTFWLLDNLISVCRFCAADRLIKHWTSEYSA